MVKLFGFLNDDKFNFRRKLTENKDSFVSYSSIDGLNQKSEEGLTSSSFDLNRLPGRLSGNYSSDGAFSGSLTDFMFASKMERPTFIIGESDTLVSIAEALFNNGSIGYLLAELNQDRTNQKRSKGGKLVVEARVRDILRLPVSDDIEEFEKRDMKQFNPHNLITIVKETAIKKEVVEKVLKPVVAPVWPRVTLRDFRVKFKESHGIQSFEDLADRVKLKSVIVNGIKVSRSIDL